MINNSNQDKQYMSIYAIIWTWFISLFIKKQQQQEKTISKRFKPRDPGLYYYDLDENITTVQDMDNYFDRLFNKIILLEKCGNRIETMNAIAHFNRQATGTMYNTFIANLEKEQFHRAMQRMIIVQSMTNRFIYE